MDQTTHLSLDDILSIRDQFAVDDPLRFELINAPGLISALTTPFQSAFGQAAFPTLTDKSVALVFLLISNHPFRDGNKRIAGAALRLFLQRNGYACTADTAAMRYFTALVLHIADPRDERLATWVAAHTHQHV